MIRFHKNKSYSVYLFEFSFLFFITIFKAVIRYQTLPAVVMGLKTRIHFRREHMEDYRVYRLMGYTSVII